MCGRYALATTPEGVEQEFSMIRIEWFPPRHNIAPTQPILVIRGEKGERRPVLMRWGLIPSWAKDIASLPLFFNARSETAATKPAFRGAFRHHRCLIPATGFYEWRKEPDGKRTPFYVRPKTDGVFAFAGLFDEWADANGNMLDSATILTTAANEDLVAIHDRMPVIVERKDYDRWLGLGPEGGEALERVLVPPEAGRLDVFPVDTRVNQVRNDDPSIQAPIGPAVTHADAKPTTSAVSDRQLKLF